MNKPFETTSRQPASGNGSSSHAAAGELPDDMLDLVSGGGQTGAQGGDPMDGNVRADAEAAADKAT